MKITKIKDVDNYNKDSIYEIEDNGMKVKVMIPWYLILPQGEEKTDYEGYFGLNLVFSGHYE